MQFTYKAQKDGHIYENTIDAPDRFFVYQHVRKEGGTIVSLDDGKTGVFGFSENLKFLNNIFGRIKVSEKIMFARNLSIMMKAGLALSKALSILERQTKNKKFKNVLNKVDVSIKKGLSLNEAFSKFGNVFDPLFTSMIKAGEESGGLSEALEVIARQMNKAYILKKKIKSALIYPFIIVIAMFIIGAVMLVYVVPTLTKTFSELNVELPNSTQFVIALSNFLVNNTIIAIILIIILTIASIAGFHSKKGRRIFEYAILHIPVISTMIKETNSARTTRTLSSLLSSGVEVVSSLSITGEVIQNSYYKDILKQSGKDIQKGLPLSKAFMDNEKLYPILVGEMIAVGEETGQLSDMLHQVAEFYESEVEQKTKNMSTIIEPFLMILIGTAVGFFAVSMISPIYSISSGI